METYLLEAQKFAHSSLQNIDPDDFVHIEFWAQPGNKKISTSQNLVFHANLFAGIPTNLQGIVVLGERVGSDERHGHQRFDGVKNSEKDEKVKW